MCLMLMFSEPPYTAIRRDQRNGLPDYFPRETGFDRTETVADDRMIISVGKTMAWLAKAQAIRF
jgi:hypothetical protein